MGEALSGSVPLLSVIVPVYNSSDMLERCLDALAQSREAEYEVIVVDDGSTQPLEPIVARRGFHYLRIDGPGGPARARNHGSRVARGDYLVFIDADVCVHPDTLCRLAERFAADPGLTAVIGTYDNSPAVETFLSQYKNLFHHYVHQYCDGPMETFWSGCGAMRRDVFMEFGGFDEERYRRPAIEDIELGTWLCAAGHRIVLDRTVQCKHLKRWTLAGLIKSDVFDRGIPWTRLMLRAGALAGTLNVRSSQRLSVASAYLTIGAIIAGLFWRPAWGIAAGLFVLVTVLNLDFYRYFARHRGWWFALRSLPLHWLYFVYCGLSFGVGALQHFTAGRTGQPSSRAQELALQRREAGSAVVP